ncbi:adenosylcobinamide-GDP ribazoletransferase [Planotetraspora kaengkrachanensis]|uniref:Adenosylcobinamide-GDP ribazoletransferase n=2 Tax=Planotetraspora kaengkrachanensis TaxID=575193 RepID=A0A8J3PQR3_9ACTN|nr:adenosylcobinamide-GDP ribazoletransferase [Planotetraspora kaengkrachanensis]
MLTVFPVRAEAVDRTVAGRGMALAPFAGMLLGLVAAAVLLVADGLSGSAPLAAALAVGTLAWLTRGLHLDGLADLADGLGSRAPSQRALDIMKQSDIGPFGVVTLIFTLLVQVGSLARIQAAAPPFTGALALVAACAAGRLAVTWACRDGVPPARPDGLGALVAGAVRRRHAIAATAATAGVLALAAFAIRAGAPPVCPFNPDQWAAGLCASAGASASASLALVLALVLAPAAGLGTAVLLRRRAVRRLGGVTGDVLGALVEISATVTLLVWALV